MDHPHGDFSRRTLLRGAAGVGLAAATGALLAGCGGDDPAAVGGPATSAVRGTGAEPPPETTKIVLASVAPASCPAAAYMAEQFLRDEGFTDIRYSAVPTPAFIDRLAAGDFDFGVGYAAAILPKIDAGAPLVMLGGVHVGCWQIFATGGIKSMRDFKGKTVAITAPTFTDGIFMAMTLANVGLDLREDVELVLAPPSEFARLLSSGAVDAVAAFPPFSNDLRAKAIGTVVLNSMTDPPWTSYFCCMVTANSDWKAEHPVAARRALRALLKGADVVAREPARTAEHMVERGFTTTLHHAGETLAEIPYDVWRDLDPLDSIRFYALRLKEAGLVKGTPEQLIKRGTDFSHLAALEQELGRV
jgi:NitT/TauT family transport system substrate-binding protein